MPDDELGLATRLVKRDFAEDFHLGTVLKELRAGSFLGAEGGAGNLRSGILDGEIPVAAGLFAEVADFALDPDFADLDFEEVTDSPGEAGDAEGFDFHSEGVWVRGRLSRKFAIRRRQKATRCSKGGRPARGRSARCFDPAVVRHPSLRKRLDAEPHLREE